MRHHHSCFILLIAILLGSTTTPSRAAPGDPVYETCPSAEDVGDNVTCYPVTFTSKTEIHPDGIPIIGYLFVPKDRAPDEPLPVIVFAHGSGSMYSDGNHNKGLNSKHRQWVKQYTNDHGFVTLHVDSFHSRYLLPDTEGDQRIMEIDVPPENLEDPASPGVGGDDYRATSYLGSRDAATRIDIAFDPDPASAGDKWKDSNNGGAGVSEVMERAYDMDAAWDFLAGIRQGQFISTPNSRNEDDVNPTLGTPMTGVGYIGEIVQNGIVIDHERIFLYGTSHGGQAAIAAAHAPRALANTNPMNADMPEGFDGKRFAAFFDYYGGCGLFGAYGGTGSDSTWRPYAPFLMLHGENDEIWVDEKDNRRPTTREDWFDNGDCENRIAAAKADPDFEQFLEAIVYQDAYHSFDGVGRDDFNDENDTGDGGFNDWAAKIHANYLVTLPIMRVIGHHVAQARGGATSNLSLAGLGLDRLNPWFHTVPLKPNVPPLAKVPLPIEIEIPDATNAVIDLREIIDDAYGVYTPTCSARYPKLGYALNDCAFDFEMTEVEIESLATTRHRQVFSISTPAGAATITARLLPGVSDNAVVLELRDAIYTLKDTNLTSPLTANGALFDIRGLAWTSMDGQHDWLSTYFPVVGSGFSGIDPDDLAREIHVGGPATGSVARIEVNAYTTNGIDRQGFTFDIVNNGDGYASITCCSLSGAGEVGNLDSPLPAPTLMQPDFSGSYVPLIPIGSGDDDGSGDDGSGDDGSGDDGSGDDGSGDDGSGDDGSGDDGSGDDGSGDDGSGDDGSGDDGSGDDGSGDDGSGDDGSGDDGSGDGGSGDDGSDGDDSDDEGGDSNNIQNPGSGGGALFWLLPFTLLFNRRK